VAKRIEVVAKTVGKRIQELRKKKGLSVAL
jgi:hypothetical protein